MTYSELLNKYVVCQKFSYDKEVLLCTNKSNGKMCIVEQNKNGYFESNKNIEDYINDIYGFNVLKNLDSRMDKRIYGAFRYKTIINILVNMNEIILETAKLNNADLLKQVVKNFNSLKIKANGESSTYGEQVLSAQYFNGMHQLTIPQSLSHLSILEQRQLLFHEMLHCSADKSQGKVYDTTAFSQLIKDDSYNNKFVPGFYIFDDLNEAITQHLTETYFLKNYGSTGCDNICLYDFNILALDPLLQQMDEQKIFEYYLSGNIDDFIDYFAKTFHIDSQIEIAKFFTQLYNTPVLIAKNDAYVGKNELSIRKTNEELIKTTINFLVNKFISEGKDLDKISLNEILKTTKPLRNNAEYIALIQSKELQDYFESAKFCLKYLKRCAGIDIKTEHTKFIKMYADMVFYSRTYAKLPQDKQFEIMKTYEVISSLCSAKYNYLLTKSSKYDYLDLPIEPVRKYILDPKNNYLPKNIEKQNVMLGKLILSSYKTDDEIIGCINPDLLIRVCSNNKAVFLAVLQERPLLIAKNLDKINPKIANDLVALNCFFYELSSPNATQDKKLDAILSYYSKLNRDYRLDNYINSIIKERSAEILLPNKNAYDLVLTAIKLDKKNKLSDFEYDGFINC